MASGLAGALDPDHLGPQAAADQGGLGPEAQSREVEDAQASSSAMAGGPPTPALWRHGRRR